MWPVIDSTAGNHAGNDLPSGMPRSDEPPQASPEKPKKASLLVRVASALVLAPPILAAFYYGTPYSEAVVLLAAGLLTWEWSRLCGGGRLGLAGIVAIGGSMAAVAAGALSLYPVSSWLIAVGAMAVLLAARREPGKPIWYVYGLLYSALPCLGLLWLRQDPEQGRALVFWLLFVVWATDIGAYFAGRAIGGPKLAPRFSPNKTWAGLVGGAVCAAAVGAGMAALRPLGGPEWPPLTAAGASLLLALVAQTGDVFESGIKRHFGVKDSSQLIPGHGGLMDRLDGLIAVTLVVALFFGLRKALA